MTIARGGLAGGGGGFWPAWRMPIRLPDTIGREKSINPARR
jgi:hypothetical protein